jgi:transposase
MKIFKVSYKTMYNWLNRWEYEGMLGLYNKPGRGRKKHLILHNQLKLENG